VDFLLSRDEKSVQFVALYTFFPTHGGAPVGALDHKTKIYFPENGSFICLRVSK